MPPQVSICASCRPPQSPVLCHSPSVSSMTAQRHLWPHHVGKTQYFFSQQWQRGYIGTELRLKTPVLILDNSTRNVRHFDKMMVCGSRLSPLKLGPFSLWFTVIILGRVWNCVLRVKSTEGAVRLRLCCRLELICSVSWDLSCLEWNLTLVHPSPPVLIRKLCSTLVRWQATFLQREREKKKNPQTCGLSGPVLKLNKHSLCAQQIFLNAVSTFREVIWCGNSQND